MACSDMLELSGGVAGDKEQIPALPDGEFLSGASDQRFPKTREERRVDIRENQPC